ncbi:MAG: ribosome maturation factor RimM [Oscillospiraceae bacterium]|nr:ribosome maturation factor RimM [Oscillospiraceae bacterium]
MIKAFLEIGQIVGTHGVRGELRVNPWCDSPAFVTQFDTLYFDAEGQRSVRVLSCRPHGNVALLTLEGVDDISSAAALRGRKLFMRRSDAKIGEGSYFVAELIGCEAVDADDEHRVYGTLADVSRTGANDVWHIKDSSGREHLIPAVPAIVAQVDVERGTVKIRPITGMFDDMEDGGSDAD